jgi:hypothetical protein
VARGQVLGTNRDAPPRPIPKSFWTHARVVRPERTPPKKEPK